MCRGLAIPRPSLPGGLGGRRNYAKNVQLVNRARGGGAGFGGEGVAARSRKGSEQPGGGSGMVCHDGGAARNGGGEAEGGGEENGKKGRWMEWRPRMIRRGDWRKPGVGVTVSRCERILLLAQGHLSTSISSTSPVLCSSIHALAAAFGISKLLKLCAGAGAFHDA